MRHEIRRGDIYYANLPFALGSEQGGSRPILIIQNDTGNKHSDTVVAAPITSKALQKKKLPTHCSIRAQQGLGRDSLVLLEQIRVIDKSRLSAYLGTLGNEDMRRINKALAVSVGLK